MPGQMLLYLNPTAPSSKEPQVDAYTRKMAAALRQATVCATWRGFHSCSSCRVRSTNADYLLPNGIQANSLCVHYLAWHRIDVPADQLLIVSQLDCKEEEPTNEELGQPIWTHGGTDGLDASIGILVSTSCGIEPPYGESFRRILRPPT